MTDDEIMSIWRTDLMERISRARLRFEAVGLDPEEIIALSREWNEYQAAAAYLHLGRGHED